MPVTTPERQAKNPLLLEKNQNQSTVMLKWSEFRKNPWNVFPNYNNQVDSVLREAQGLLERYRLELPAFEKAQIEFESFKKQTNSGKINYSIKQENFQFFFNIFCSAILFFLTFTFIFLFKPFGENPGMLTAFGILALFAFNILSPMPFAKLITNAKQRTEDASTLKALEDTLRVAENKVGELQKQYAENSSKILKGKPHINIKEHLHHIYYCDVPELNTMVESIINENYPDKKNSTLSLDMYYDYQNKEKISPNHHTDIFMYIKHLVAEKTRHIVSEKILNHISHKTIKRPTSTRKQPKLATEQSISSQPKKTILPSKAVFKTPAKTNSEENRWKNFDKKKEWTSFANEDEWENF